MSNQIPKYEKLYREGRDVCGPPFPEFVEFFQHLEQEPCRVLDLGCGQGRDALFIARQGHSVLGVDLSATGITQMLEDAAKEGLKVEGVVADIAGYEPDEAFDVILLDRVLHMLPDDHERLAVLERAAHHTRQGGFILIADTSKNKGALAGFFARRKDQWHHILDKKGLLFFQKQEK